MNDMSGCVETMGYGRRNGGQNLGRYTNGGCPSPLATLDQAYPREFQSPCCELNVGYAGMCESRCGGSGYGGYIGAGEVVSYSTGPVIANSWGMTPGRSWGGRSMGGRSMGGACGRDGRKQC